ncbi:TPA: type IV secretion system protein [Escherichia coli]|nr:type IV secretion system protein [Escherichia coli]HAX5186581.1 type IV secretion system protein [Escherichia coli]HAX5233302.1 type IV secretion system protein [Escherichia coli]
MSGGTFVGVEKYLIGGITDATQGVMMSYSSMMMGLAGTSATIYIMWRGYQTLAGKLSTPIEDVIWAIMRMAIILSFVANINGYLDGVIDAINGIKEGFSSSTSIWQLLDTLWNNAKILGKTLHDLDGSEFIKDEGTIAELFVWGGTFALMIITAFVSMIAEVMILLLGLTAPIFIFCLMYGVLLPMFNNWLQNIFTAILTILLSSLALRIVINYLTLVMKKAISIANNSTIVELGAQVCLAGVCAAVLVYISAKLAASLAGAGATATMQGAAALGISAAAYGAGKMLKEAGKVLPKEVASPSNKGLGDPQSRIVFNAADARKHAIEQMIARNEARMLTDQSAPKLPPSIKRLPPPR